MLFSFSPVFSTSASSCFSWMTDNILSACRGDVNNASGGQKKCLSYSSTIHWNNLTVNRNTTSLHKQQIGLGSDNFFVLTAVFRSRLVWCDSAEGPGSKKKKKKPSFPSYLRTTRGLSPWTCLLQWLLQKLLSITLVGELPGVSTCIAYTNTHTHPRTHTTLTGEKKITNERWRA